MLRGAVMFQQSLVYVCIFGPLSDYLHNSFVMGVICVSVLKNSTYAVSIALMQRRWRLSPNGIILTGFVLKLSEIFLFLSSGWFDSQSGTSSDRDMRGTNDRWIGDSGG